MSRNAQRNVANAAGGVPVPVDCDPGTGFQPDIERLEAAVTDATRMLVVNSPCNPTGSVFGRETLLALADLARRHDLLLVSDETYEHIIYDGHTHHSLATLAPDLADRLVTINSVSKAHSMTGWRIGYAAMPPDLADKVTYLQAHSTSGPCAVAQRAALTALTGDQSHVAVMVADYARRRDLLLDRLAGIEQLTCHKPQGTFYLFLDVTRVIGTTVAGHAVRDADGFTAMLSEAAGVRVASGSTCGTDRHVRLSFAASPAVLDEAIDRIAALWKG